jgi:hypothetical protein
MSEYDPDVPHTPTTSERLSLLYRTGDESGRSAPDNGEAFSGLVKRKAQRLLEHRDLKPDAGQMTFPSPPPCGVAERKE